MSNDAYDLLGQNGNIDIDAGTGTVITTGKNRPRALQAINGAVTFTALTDDLNTSGIAAVGAGEMLVDDVGLGVGEIVYGRFSTIDVATGTVRAYL